jgi:dihydroneopterin aldolase
MTLFLASVNGVAEAEIAFAGGADIIDLKDARSGALGALPLDAVNETVAAFAGRCPVSAVTGDLPMHPYVLRDAALGMARTGVDYVKVGLFAGGRRGECIRALAPAAERTKLVGVMFADDQADTSLLAVMAEAGFAGAMLDTARKGGGGLLEHTDIVSLRDFVDACRAHRLIAGLAGSLEPPDIPRLLALSPDLLGFRGALCAGHARAGTIDPAAVGLVRGLIPSDPRSARSRTAAPKVDYRLLGARGYSADQSRDCADTDRVFLRDYVIPVRIGAYARERETPQDVRFDVEVEVLRTPHPAEDMRDVFSYDVVIDAIRMAVAHTHVALVETLAERIAAQVLAHARAVKVRVRVEKLSVGPGSVGVEIVRQRPAEVARIHALFPTARRDGEKQGAE